MSNFWSGWIILFTVANIIGIWWLLRVTARPTEGKDNDTTGHSWDGITEYNKPLPRWWLWMFYISIVFGIGYLILFPGLGNFKGTLGWSQTDAYQQEVEIADIKYGALFQEFSATDVETLSHNPEAVRVGQRLFLNSCAQCHGSDARGVPGFPNLADDDWLYGGSADAIKTTIMDGRSGTMPAMGSTLGASGIQEVIAYIRGLNQYRVDETLAAAGKEKFGTYCAACHSPNATGNQLVGAPNLTNNVWLHGGSEEALFQTIARGRKGYMPAHKDILGEDKVHLIATYIYSLSAGLSDKPKPEPKTAATAGETSEF